jgi:methylglutaconyl-CoA hydratase
VARTLASVLRGAPQAVRAAKALIAGLRDGDPAPQALQAAEALARRRASEEGREGIAAFLERREPRW